MNKKYRLLKEDIRVIDGKVCHRIQALRDIGDDVKRGDLGGYVESEYNLSKDDESWIYPESFAYGNNICKNGKNDIIDDEIKSLLKEKAKPDPEVLNTVQRILIKDIDDCIEYKSKSEKEDKDAIEILENKLFHEKENLLNLLKLSFHSECKLNNDLNTMMYVGQIAEIESVLKMVEEIK